MKEFKEELNDLVAEYAAVPSAANPASLASFCRDIESGVNAIDAISRVIGDGDIDPDGIRYALAVLTTQLQFNAQVMQLMLRKQAGHF